MAWKNTWVNFLKASKKGRYKVVWMRTCVLNVARDNLREELTPRSHEPYDFGNQNCLKPRAGKHKGSRIRGERDGQLRAGGSPVGLGSGPPQSDGTAGHNEGWLWFLSLHCRQDKLQIQCGTQGPQVWLTGCSPVSPHPVVLHFCRNHHGGTGFSLP